MNDAKPGGVLGPLRVERPCTEIGTNLRLVSISTKKSKCQVLQWGWGRTGCMYRMGGEGRESSPAKRDLCIPVGGNLNPNLQKGQLCPEGCLSGPLWSQGLDLILVDPFQLGILHNSMAVVAAWRNS